MVKIGIPLKYYHLEDNRCILYLGEKVRRTMQKAGAFIIPIVQGGNFDYANSKYDETREITDKEKVEELSKTHKIPKKELEKALDEEIEYL